MDNPVLIYPWHLIGEPPTSQVLIYRQIWHLELVLRHVAFASLRRTYGQEWEAAMNQVSAETGSEKEKKGLSVIADERRSREKSPASGNLVWYLTTQELQCVYSSRKLWNGCFTNYFPSLDRKDLTKRAEIMVELRNPWAHFRPSGDVAQQYSRLLDFAAYLETPLRDWYCHYWNSDPVVDPNHSIVKQYNGSVPIALHGMAGFWKKEWTEDRGWQLFLEINEVQDCYWVSPHFVGGANTLGLNAVFRLAEELAPLLTHVVINFSKRLVAEQHLEHHGIEDVYFGIPRQDGDDRICKTLEKLSSFILENINVRRDPPLGSSSESVLPFIQSELFKSAPSNVLVIPTIDGRREFQIRVE